MVRVRRDRGFTLVEVVISIVVVGVLTAVVVVGVGSLTSTGSTAACQASSDAARAAAASHLALTGSAPQSFTAMVSSGALTLPSGVSADAGGRRLLGSGWELVMSSGATLRLACVESSGTTPAFALDAASVSPSAAFSMRRTSATYSGPAVRVRRSTDGTEADIGFATTVQTRQNLLANPTMAGAVAGTPGTLPTGWFVPGTPTLSRQVLGSGVTTDGQAYVDLRLFGTATDVQFRMSLDGVATTVGQRHVVSVGVRTVAGTASDMFLRLGERDAGGTLLAWSNGADFRPTTTLARSSFTRVSTDPAVTKAHGELVWRLVTGTTYDMTTRIVLPNVEAGRSMNARPLSTTGVTTVAVPGELDLDALEAFVGSGSGFVTTWYDQSGNARHAAQTTADAQPRIVQSGAAVTVGGRIVPSFDGNDILVVGGSAFGAQAFPFAAVTTFVRQDPTVGNRTVWGNRANPSPDGGRFLRSLVDAVNYSHPGCCAPPTIAVADGAGTVHSIVVTGTEMRQRVNGGSDTTTPQVAIDPVTRGWAIGAQAAGDTQRMVGVIGEVVLFDGAPTAPEIAGLERSQGAYFGIAVG